MLIRIDNREDKLIINAFKQAKYNKHLLNVIHDVTIDIDVTTLESGDFVMGEYALEHKNPADYFNSLKSGRLYSQIETMQRNFKSCAIIVDGTANEMLFSDIGTGSFASCWVRGVPVLICGNLQKMVEVSVKLLHKWNDGKNRAFDPSINQKLAKDTQLNMLTGIKGISLIHGASLINHFKSIHAIDNASIEDMQKVDGIGQKKALNIYEAFHNPRW